ncbi:unnamed protein product, partial [Acidithrix sp. C25]
VATALILDRLSDGESAPPKKKAYKASLSRSNRYGSVCAFGASLFVFFGVASKSLRILS